MRSSCILLGLLVVGFAASARAQEAPAGAPDTAHADSDVTHLVPPAPAEPPPPPPAPAVPTEEQERYTQGLQRVGRGVAQLKTAVERVKRSQASRDTVSQRRASHRLGGYCGSARFFMTGGRARMDHMAYSDTTRVVAHRLVLAVDGIIKYTSQCEAEAATATATVMRELSARLSAYDAALADFRAATTPPAALDSGNAMESLPPSP